MNIDQQAQFVSLLTEHQVTLRAYVLSQLPGAPEASDVVQQTNLILWEKRDTFEIGTNFRAWMVAIARYQVLTYRKKLAQNRLLLFDADLSHLLADSCAPEPGDLDEKIMALDHCLSKLSKKDRLLIEQRYAKPEPLTSYARQIGESAGAMRVTLHRIRTALRKCINVRLKRQNGDSFA